MEGQVGKALLKSKNRRVFIDGCIVHEGIFEL